MLPSADELALEALQTNNSNKNQSLIFLSAARIHNHRMV